MKQSKTPAVKAAGIAALCIASELVLAQGQPIYRDGEPATLNGAEERRAAADAERATVTADFKSAYANAGRPKIALFWHRQLDDSISSTRAASAQVTSQGALPEHNYDVNIKVESKTGGTKAYSLAPPPRAAEFESGFQSALRAAGVQFVDRNTIVRLSALGATRGGEHTKDLDAQAIEMQALSGYAEYFAEVNFIADASVEDGLQVRVTVINTRTGVIVADVVPTELYEHDRDRSAEKNSGTWRATPNGFEKAQRRKNGADEGRNVAHALMAQMISQLASR